MLFGNRTLAAGFGAAMLLASSHLSVVAQEPKPATKSAKSESVGDRKATGPVRRVPIYFNQTGLTPEQKESIYKVQAKHQEKIDDLRRQLVEARVQMMKECEEVLTDTQRELLEHRRRAAAKADKEPKEAAPAAKSAEPSSSN